MRAENKKPGFTLIELLVVVSIIALLVSILLPALGRAREQAKSVICLSNVRQYGLAVYLYVDEHDGSFPTYMFPDEDGRYIVGYRCHTALHALRELGYLGADVDIICPSDKHVAVYERGPCSYGYNILVGDPTTPAKLERIRYPSELFVLMDAHMAMVNPYTQEQIDMAVAFRHADGSGVNVLHGDSSGRSHMGELPLIYDDLGEMAWRP